MTERPEKGRALFYTRDSHGRSEMTPGQYVAWAQRRATEIGVSFCGTDEQIDDMIRHGVSARGDIFLDYGIKGNVLSRPGLNALQQMVLADNSVSHVLIPRRDRLARPHQPTDGIMLEATLREAGATLVFMDRICPPFPRGKRRDIADLIAAVVDYDKSGIFLRELAEKILYAQVALARLGFSTGGRPPYGFRRWLVTEDGARVRELSEGEYVRKKEHHVVWLPGPQRELDVIRRILRELTNTPALRVAKALTAEGIPSPDAGRTRTDNGVCHHVSGHWHQTTIVGIARNSLLVAVATYGRRSMGDHLRLDVSQPRELHKADYRDDGKAKVTQNPASIHIRTPAPVAFDPLIDPQKHAELMKILDHRGGTQRGKPRSRDPKANPLGSRIFDLNCSWPMYRQPYQKSFRYLCGQYQQSHGKTCQHNCVDGPTAVRFVVACVAQRLFAPAMLVQLEERLNVIAMQEVSVPPSVRNTKNVALSTVIKKKKTAERNLALAANREQFEAIASVVEELREQQSKLEREIERLPSMPEQNINLKQEVAAAMALARNLTEFSQDMNSTQLTDLFRRINARLFLRFQRVQEGKRTLNKLQSGVVTFGTTPPPIRLYDGPTSRKKLKGPTAESAAEPLVPNLPSCTEPIGSGREGKSLGNVSRGDKTPLELFIAGVQCWEAGLRWQFDKGKSK